MLEFAHAGEGVAPDGALGDESEPALHHVNPRIAREPRLDFGMLVGDVIVRDQVQIQIGRCLLADLAQEIEELLMPVLSSNSRDHLPVGNVECGEQDRGAVANVVVGHALDIAKAQRSRRTTQAVALRARIILLTADGFAPTTIAEELGTSQPTVRKWRARYVEDGLAGLRNEPRPGRPRSLDDQRVADLLNPALQTRPAKQTHWSVRSFAAEANISARTWRNRLFRAASIAPHRSRSFKLSNDPAFVEKVRDITGLYLSPPDHALVLCVDEKSQIQALERTQPLLPMHAFHASMRFTPALRPTRRARAAPSYR